MAQTPDGAKPARRRRRKRSTALFCFGLDGKDGHTRITKGDAFLLVGGSEDTHDRMQDFTMRLAKALEERGTRLAEASPRQIRDAVSEID
jgi:hypothetical protein